jgi:hypothetical protein
MLTMDQFLAEIDRYLDAAKMSPSAFGRAVVGDPNFVTDLRAGRAPNLRLVGKVNDFIQRNPATKAGQDAA